MYAVYSIVGEKKLDTYTNWNECAFHVLRHNSIYKKVGNTREARQYFNEQDKKDEKKRSTDLSEYEGKTDIVGTFAYSLYENKENGYCVYLYEVPGETGMKRVTVRGYFLPATKKIKYRFKGEFVRDKKYGMQFVAERFEEKIADTKEGMISYLASGTIKGIGVKTAERIYELYGEESISIIEREPEKLLKVKGVTKSRLEKIIASYGEGRGAQVVVQFLIQYGIHPKTAMRVYRSGITSLQRIQDNPYILCNIRGIPFEVADMIARKAGIASNDCRRMEACARHVLKEFEQRTGSVCMEKDEFGFAMLEALSDDDILPEEVLNETCRQIKEKNLIYKRVLYYGGEEKGLIFLPERYAVEQESARMLADIYCGGKKRERPDLDDFIESYCRKKNIVMDAMQIEAIRSAVTYQCSVITGGPGTGKTTLELFIVWYLKKIEPKNEIYCIAPTGLAARKMTQSTGVKASTIHSLLRLNAGSPDELMGEEGFEVIDNATFIMDESSMTDIYLLHILLRAMGTGCRLIFIGDTGQLPSVGPGAVLRDIILSGVIPVVKLQNIFRQKQGSEISEITKRINEGNVDIHSGKEFIVYESDDMEEIQYEMVEVYKKRIAEYGQKNVLLIVPYKKYAAGVENMNRILQDECNPPDMSKRECFCYGKLFREGDVIMNTRNTDKVANGDTGVISAIHMDGEAPVITVCFFDNLYIDYDLEAQEDLTLAYAISVHKAQGSEAECTITCLTNFHRRFLFRNFPNTQISRGKKHVDFFGSMDALRTAISTEWINNRLSLFWYHLRVYGGEFVPI